MNHRLSLASITHPSRGWSLENLRRLPWGNALAFGLPFLLYVVTLAPTVFNLDSAELTTAAATGGITRATGYPLYLLLGRVWSWLPIGDVGYRLNLLSAFCGALTIALADKVLRRLRIGRIARLGALGMLTCATYFWALALIAEVYTLHTVLMLGLILALLHWAAAPSPRRLGLVGLVGGLGLSHHGAMVLLIPGALWFVLTTAPRQVLTPRALLLGIAGVVLGLLPYLYLPLRLASLPSFNYSGSYTATGTFVPIDLQTPAGLWWLVSGRAFAGQMLGYTGGSFWSETLHFGAQLWQAFFGIGIGPGLLGLILLCRRSWRFGGMLVLMFLGNALFYIDYQVMDKDTMFLPNYVIWAVWLAVGYDRLVRWMQGTDATRNGSTLLVQSSIVGAAVLACVWNWQLVDLSDDWSARTRGEAILHHVAPQGVIFGWWDTVPVVQYLQLVEGQRPDVLAINRFLVPPETLPELMAYEARQRPIYSDTLPSAGMGQWQSTPAGPVYALHPIARPSAAERGMPPLHHR